MDIEITKWIIMAFAYGMAAGAGIMFISIKLGLRQERKERKIWHKLDMKLLGLNEDECKEHHLPGDCPLCGAK